MKYKEIKKLVDVERLKQKLVKDILKKKKGKKIQKFVRYDLLNLSVKELKAIIKPEEKKDDNSKVK